ncbi:uncharacterized protein LOC120337338 [Styela clava]|uniref:uncharacterized protein LOC120337338 n=1 Tax=Styela clava TaxID=7725 RepID=UPI0019395872|nr:uncharacterized protein LOC120337338 [Styela clava]
MPNYATPGHPYSSQSIYVTVSPVYKKRGSNSDHDFKPQESFSRRLPNISQRVQSAADIGLVTSSKQQQRAHTAPPTYKYPPRVDHKHRLITTNFKQNTPWCRDMCRWFTPDRTQGVWYDNEDFDRYRQSAFKFRLPAQHIYHTKAGLMPNYSGYVPGQAFRYGGTWARETANARMIGIARKWESTSYFQDRPIGA